jgi:integrase
MSEQKQRKQKDKARANAEGTLYQRSSDGLWVGAITLGFPDGRQKRKTVSAKTQGAARAKLQRLKEDHAAGLLPTEPTMSVKQWFEHWLKVKSKEVSARTIEEYGYALRHVLKHIGRVRLDKLTPLQVQRMQLAIADEVSPRQAVHARGLLHNALDDAMKLGLLGRNVVTAVDPVKYQRPEFDIWNAQQVMKFLEATQGSRYHPLYYLALTSGMRPGELIALRWEDVSGLVIHVRRSVSLVKGKAELGGPKTKHSNRLVDIPKDTAQVLQEHIEALREDGLDGSLVFPSRTGNLLQHGNIGRSLEAFAKQADVPVIRTHDLRHTYASMAIEGGMSVVRLSKQLGHSDPGFTLRVYAHLFDRYQRHEAPSLSDLLGLPSSSSST